MVLLIIRHIINPVKKAASIRMRIQIADRWRLNWSGRWKVLGTSWLVPVPIDPRAAGPSWIGTRVVVVVVVVGIGSGAVEEGCHSGGHLGLAKMNLMIIEMDCWFF